MSSTQGSWAVLFEILPRAAHRACSTSDKGVGTIASWASALRNSKEVKKELRWDRLALRLQVLKPELDWGRQHLVASHSVCPQLLPAGSPRGAPWDDSPNEGSPPTAETSESL